MRELLFVAMFFTLTTVSYASSTFMHESLTQQYNVQRENITTQCEAEAKSLMYITQNRDAGVPVKAVVNAILAAAAKEQKEQTLQRPLTVEDVLFEIGIITVIYHSPMTQEEIFNSQFRICEKESLDILNAMYKRALEIQNER